MALLVVIISSQDVMDRVLNLSKGTDASATGRLNEPLKLLLDTVSAGKLLGINESDIYKALDMTSIDNAILRLLIYYGMLVIPAFHL